MTSQSTIEEIVIPIGGAKRPSCVVPPHKDRDIVCGISHMAVIIIAHFRAFRFEGSRCDYH